jgi:hypothetical protein
MAVLKPFKSGDRVKCVDNTLQKDVLSVGRDYEIAAIDHHYDNIRLVGYGDKNFSKRRFIPVA